MRAFVLSGLHKRAMPKLMEWCDEAAVVHWDQSTAELPSWSEAHRRMVQEGRQSKVRYPSRPQTRQAHHSTECVGDVGIDSPCTTLSPNASILSSLP